MSLQQQTIGTHGPIAAGNAELRRQKQPAIGKLVVIEGTERVLRYNVAAGDIGSDYAVLAPAGEYVVAPGYVDVVPPRAPHAEIAGEGRTVAVIVRSERVGGFPQNMYDLATGGIVRRPGPASIPHSL